jgi:hypothetical protein
VSLGKIGATPVDARHRDMRIGPCSAGCASLRTGYFCAAQSKEFNQRTNAQQFGERQGIFPILGFDWRF